MQRQSLTTYHKQTDAQSVSKQWPPWKTVHCSALRLLPLPPVFIAEHDATGKEYPFGSWLWSLPTPCPFPVHLLEAERGEEKRNFDAMQSEFSTSRSVGALWALF